MDTPSRGSRPPASPHYGFKHSGPCIVAGNAFNLHEDLAKTRVMFPEAPVIAVNGAAGEVAAIGVFSYHPAQFVMLRYRWINKQKRFGEDFKVHAARFEDSMPWVDHWWESARGAGGSTWGARKLAALMGFGPVILCGSPFLPGNYAGHKLGQHMIRQDVVDNLMAEIASDTDWHDGAYSMSGRTRDLLGEPE